MTPLPALVFVAVLGIILVPYVFFVSRPEDLEKKKLKRRLKNSTAVKRTRQALIKEVEQLSSVGAINRLLGSATRVTVPAQRLIEQSGLRLTVGTFFLWCGCAGLIPFFLVRLLSGNIVAGLVVGCCTAFIPYLWVRRARTKRLWKFEEQFPEAIDLISRALKAGHTFPTGLSMVADEMSDPVGSEFRLLFDQQNFGMPLPEALRSFAERVPLIDAKFFATAVLTQRDAGGNLAEVLDNLASVIRERFKVKRQVRVISAHGRITGWVLSGLPPSLSIIFFIVTPKHIPILFGDPLGVRMLIAAVVLQIVGTLLIRKIVNIEY
jgi:tight adherence protein B